MPEARNVLHARGAEAIASFLQFLVQPLQHAQAELALALDRHHLRMRQLVRRVRLELNAFLEVDKVEFDMLRTARQREIGDDDVEKRRFSRTRFSGEERVRQFVTCDVEAQTLRPPPLPTGSTMHSVGQQALYAFEAADGTIKLGTREEVSTWLQSRVIELQTAELAASPEPAPAAEMV